MQDSYYKKLLHKATAFANRVDWRDHKETYVNRSIDWFREAVNRGGTGVYGDGGTIRRSLKMKTSLQQNHIRIGQMYFFGYHAKYDGTPQLPYWDAFPLIFPIGETDEHFTGLNLHYLQPNLRAVLLDTLVATQNAHQDKSRIYVTYTTLCNLSGHKYFKPCFKKYLKSHVMTSFIHVPREEWENALFLPVADWRDASHKEVWEESESLSRSRQKRISKQKKRRRK